MSDLVWETFDTEIDYRCPGFAVRRDDVRFPDGTTGEFHTVQDPPAIVILPFTVDGDVVVIDEWRQAVGRVNRGIPAGTVESVDRTATDGVRNRPSSLEGTTEGQPMEGQPMEGQPTDLERAAARELAEETGYEAAAFEHLITVEPANGLLDAVHHHFVATGCTPTAERDLDHNESIAVDVVPYDDLLADAVDGNSRDGRTVTAVLQYELTRR